MKGKDKQRERERLNCAFIIPDDTILIMLGFAIPWSEKSEMKKRRRK